MMPGKGLVIYTYSLSQWMDIGMAIPDLIQAPPAVAAVQSLSCVQLYGTSWTAARQASLPEKRVCHCFHFPPLPFAMK